MLASTLCCGEGNKEEENTHASNKLKIDCSPFLDADF